MRRAPGRGIDFIELRVGLDGLAVVANPEADWLTGITLGELNILWGPEAEGTITRWNQVRASWPDEEITLFGPDVDSGTFDFLHRGSERRVQGVAGRLHELGG